MNDVMRCCAEQISEDMSICRRCDYEWNHSTHTPSRCKEENNCVKPKNIEGDMNGFKPTPKSPILIGDLVIINEFDRPCTRLVVLVTQTDGNYIGGEYVCKNTTCIKVSGRSETAVKLEDFGVNLIYNVPSETVRAVRVGKSRVLYQRGIRIREWQPEMDEEIQKLKSGMLNRLIEIQNDRISEKL